MNFEQPQSDEYHEPSGELTRHRTEREATREKTREHVTAILEILDTDGLDDSETRELMRTLKERLGAYQLGVAKHSMPPPPMQPPSLQ